MTAENERRPERPLPRFFYRLNPGAQRCYLKSDSIDRYQLTPTPAALDLARRLTAVVEAGSLPPIARSTRALVAEVCRLFGVPPIAVEVKGVRPHNTRGELHGLFYPAGPRGSSPARIVLWMKTAVRHDPVKPRTFVRTVLHELGHYLDYTVLKLPDSFHTGGFFKRESFLMRTLLPSPPKPRGTARARSKA